MKKNIIILTLLITAYTLYFSWLTISRHRGLFSGRYDLGNMEQTVWNTSQGRIFQMTDPTTNENSSRLAFHADFLLILIAPIYKIFPATETLLIIQAFIVALGAIPVYLIAKHVFPRRKLLPMFFSLLYLFSPILERANIFEFHSEVLSVTFLLFTFFFLLKEKTRVFLLFFFLALISKENLSLTLAMLCFWGIVKNKKRRLCAFLMICSIAYFLFIMKIAIPQANASLNRHFALRYFSDGNKKFFELIFSYIKDPIGFFSYFFGPFALGYYFKIFTFGGVIQFFSPLTLIFTAPTVVINVLTKDPQFKSLDYQYSATAVFGIIISMIYGLNNMMFFLKKAYSRKKILLKLALGLSFLFLLINLRSYSPLPLLGQKPYLDFLKYHYAAAQKINEWKTKIPGEASVSATNNVGAHFSKRQNLYLFPAKTEVSDYIVFAAKSWQDPISEEEKALEIKKIQNNPKYTLLDSGEDYFIFRKK